MTHPSPTLPETTPPVADLMADLELARCAAQDLQKQLDAERRVTHALRALYIQRTGCSPTRLAGMVEKQVQQQRGLPTTFGAGEEDR